MASKLKYLVIHCTATPEGRNVSSAEIRDWHTSPPPRGRGWRQVGYRDMIHLSGEIENLVKYDEDDTVDAWEITNGVAGINGVAAHVVFTGGKTKDNKGYKDTRTNEQKVALDAYVKLCLKRWPWLKIGGHYQFDKAKPFCPGFDMPAWLRSIGVAEENIYKP